MCAMVGSKNRVKDIIDKFIESNEKVCIIDNVSEASIRSLISRKKYEIRISKYCDKIVLTKICNGICNGRR